MQETGVRSLGGEDPLEKEMQPIPVFLEKEMATPPVLLPGESHGQRSLAGWNRTEQLTLSQHFHLDFTSIWESKNWTSGLVW